VYQYEIPSLKRTKQNTNSGFQYSLRSRWKSDWSKFWWLAHRAS